MSKSVDQVTAAKPEEKQSETRAWICKTSRCAAAAPPTSKQLVEEKGILNSRLPIVLQRNGFCKWMVVKQAYCGGRYEAELLHELDILQTLGHHPNIVRVLCTDVVDGKHRLCFERMKGGNLYDDVIKQRQGSCLPESEVRVYASAILKALVHMHSLGIVHGDIQCGNVLLRKPPTPPTSEEQIKMLLRPGRFEAPGYTIKESDIKLAEFMVSCKLSLTGASKGNNPIAMVLQRANYAHMAPEVFLQLERRRSGCALTPAYDIWSFGCSVAHMLQGSPPWGWDCKEAKQRRSQLDIKPTLPDSTSEECQDFLRVCLQTDPSARWSAENLLQHPFLTSASVPPAIASPKPQYDKLAAHEGNKHSCTVLMHWAENDGVEVPHPAAPKYSTSACKLLITKFRLYRARHTSGSIV